MYIHLGEGNLDPFLCKTLGNPAVDGVFGFIGKVILPHPDFQDEVEARSGKLFEEDRGRRVVQEILCIFNRIVCDLKERAKTLIELAEGSVFYFGDELIYEEEAAHKFLTQEAAGHLDEIIHELPLLADYSKAGLEVFLRNLAEKRNTKLKFIAQPLRVALTGKTISPGIDDVMITLGKERVLQRLQQAVQFIGE